MGEGGGDSAPLDVVRVRVDPSVTSIPAKAFYRQNKLTQLELCEGVVEIGEDPSAAAAVQLRKLSSPLTQEDC